MAGQGRHPAAAPGEAAERRAPGAPQAADRRGRVDVAICVVLRDGPLLHSSEATDLRWQDVTFQASSGSPTDRSAGARRSTPGRS